MFGVDFSELVVILAVTLIVVGPERLPKVARTFGHLWGRLQRYVHTVKTDISREMAAEEFRQMQQKIQQEAASFERETNLAARNASEQMQALDGAARGEPAAGQTQPDPAPEQKNTEIR